jgi:pimeloyl-ACP methyl ester carboxylesterase
MHVTPFRIAIAQDQLDDLQRRLRTTRWPDPSPVGGWQDGTDQAFLRQLTDHWRTGFDWRAAEAELNQLPQFTAQLDGLRTHLIHQRGTGPRPFPLLIGHGWPGTGFDLRRIIPLLTDPAGHGADPADAFDVVAPSLPGYGFSAPPDRPGTGPERVAGMWTQLMTALGYDRFGVQSGDWGAAVAMWLAGRAPDRLAGLHLNFVPGFYQPPLGAGEPPLSGEERDFVATMARWFEAEGGYHRLHSTKPQTAAYGLTDSPTGLAAWIVEKLRGWSDSHGDVTSVFTLDEILTNVSIYWFTATIGASMRFYYENRLRPNRYASGQRVAPPLGFVGFPREPVPPRSWLERVFTVTRYQTIERGSHFGAWEAPELLAAEIRAFFRPLR